MDDLDFVQGGAGESIFRVALHQEEFAFAPAAPETVRAGIGAGERGGMIRITVLLKSFGFDVRVTEQNAWPHFGPGFTIVR